MAPAIDPRADTGGVGTGKGDWRANATAEDFILEGWSEGFMVGALIIMACITIANMRRKVLLHKMILLEQLLAMSHGTFCFMAFNGYGWYLSSTAALLYCSWFIHNLVAWMKIKPFFMDPRGLFSRRTGKWTRNIYIGTLVLTIGPIILQIYDNFRFFNGYSDFYTKVRPYEPLFRDPWWVFTCLVLFHVVSKCYGTGVLELVKRSPRFGILLAAIFLSLTFTVLDIISSIHNFLGSTDGINPWWKLSLVFKCLTDTIMLDDFKTELKRLGIKRIQKEEMRRQSFALVLEDKDTDENGEFEFADALNVSPERLAEDRKQKRKGPSDGVSRGRLRHASILEIGQEEHDPDVHRREQTGHGGRKITNLPSLGISKGWHAFTSKSKIHSRSSAAAPDLEKDSPDVVRSDARQDHPSAPRSRRHSQTSDTDGDSISDESVDAPAASERSPSEQMAAAPGAGPREPSASGGNSSGSGPSQRNADHPRPPPPPPGGDTKQPGSGRWDDDDDGGLDFQTKPAGL